MRTIKLFDTTLRDGEQAPGNAMTVEQRVELAKWIDLTGVDYIEGGFPSCSSADYEATKAISELGLNASISALARANARDIECAIRATSGAQRAQIQLLLTGSEIHLEKKRHISLKDAVEETRNSVHIARINGAKHISLGCEDSSRGSLDMLKQVIAAGLEQGADCVVLADTVGGTIPSKFEEKVRAIRNFIGKDVELSVHCHNDMGLAVANSFAGFVGGADCAQVSLCGIGERAGNTAIEELVTVILYHGQDFGMNVNINKIKMIAACEKLINEINLFISPQKPIMGKYVFSTAAGIHINGMLQDPVCYESVNPDIYGRKREYIISRLSGRSIISELIEKYNLKTTSPEIIELMYKVITSSKDVHKYNDEHHFRELFFQQKNIVESKN
ncbi:LeuA family protein [Xenorhabdus thailandensis]|uniref:LeuA family protein n=1 Tax=Xenorhabdus thailandensis TaxID=3136255 RepID=UPI0030F37960